MAVTKIHAIKATLHKAMAYIENPDKTEYGQLVTGYNCSPDNATLEFAMTAEAAGKRKKGGKRESPNLAYHLIQSFSPNDPVTPEQAHEMGQQLADRFLEGKYEYVISTHVDKNHIHNHILINATSWLTGEKLRTRPFKTAQQIRAISDHICIANELSVIRQPGKLEHSYKEWAERRKYTSWKSDIRKRLNFVLARAASYDQFLSMCSELDVAVDDSGKHIKYRMRGMERWARGNKLADTEHFTLSGIQEQIQENAETRKSIWSGIAEEVGQSNDWEDFVRRMETYHGILITSGKLGLIYHTPEGAKRRESELGAAFQKEQLLHALQDRSYFPGDEPTPSIREQWEQSTSGALQKEAEFVPLELQAEDIERISLDGLMLRLDVSGEKQSFFIDSQHLDFNEETSTYTAYIASQFYYYALKPDSSPDFPESEQLGTTSLRGEDIIRSLEQRHGVEGHWVDVPAECIRSITQERLLIAMPNDNISRVAIASEDVRFNAKVCQVRLYDNWTYAKDLKGRELRGLLTSQPKTVVDSLWRRYRAYERRNDHRRTQGLAKTLRLMEREDISGLSDFALRRQEVAGERAAIESQIRLIQQKLGQYAQAHKYLVTVQKYTPAFAQTQQARGWARRKLEQRYQQELQAYRAAAEALTRMNVHTDVEPEKVQGLMDKLNEELRRYRREAEALDKRMDALVEAEDTVQNVTAVRQEDERDDQRQERKTREGAR